MKILIAFLLLLSGCSSALVKKEEPLTVTDKKESINKDITFFTFDAACWVRENGLNKTESIENLTLESASSDLIGIKQKETSSFLPTTCFLEAKERTTEVPYKTEVLDFQCFFNDDLVGGDEYNFVENLSSSLMWLVSLKDGQNVVIPKNLCLIYPKAK